MALSDAFMVVEDWISEHFFTTDATNDSFHAKVIERRKQWDGTEGATVRARFTAARNQLGLDLAELHDDEDAASQVAKARDVQDRLSEILGFAAGGWHVTTDGQIQRFSSPQLEEGRSLAIIRARPIDTVDDVFARDPDEPPWSRASWRGRTTRAWRA